MSAQAIERTQLNITRFQRLQLVRLRRSPLPLYAVDALDAQLAFKGEEDIQIHQAWGKDGFRQLWFTGIVRNHRTKIMNAIRIIKGE